jgi:E3 SUMO-protein ligase PIAS1
VEQVTIEPDGRWLNLTPKTEKKEDKSESFLDDDDGFEISEVSVVGSGGGGGGRFMETPNRSAQSTGTPMTAASRESSTMPRGSTSGKRPASQVIDLTLSSDEDEPLIRPAKRQNVSQNGYGSAAPGSYYY